MQDENSQLVLSEEKGKEPSEEPDAKVKEPKTKDKGCKC
jgi:hypothetical protein